MTHEIAHEIAHDTTHETAQTARGLSCAFSCAFSCALSCAVSFVVQAQQLQPEFRLDALGPAPASYQAGAGVVAHLGNYVRLSADVARDVRPNPNVPYAPWRADVLARVTFDPFREQRIGFSFGGGLSVRKDVLLCAIAEIEGVETRGVTTALQIGVGGGVRAGIVFRRAVQGRR